MGARTAFVALAPVVLAAGCTSGVAGQAVPRAVGAVPGASESAPVDLSDLNPCDLLTGAARSALNAAPGKRARDLPSSTGCQWKINPGAPIAESYTLGIAIYPELGTGRINSTGAKTPTSVNSRPAVQYLGAANSVCVISLEVTAASRVDVTANRAGSGGSEVCPQAKAAAELVEPELPPEG